MRRVEGPLVGARGGLRIILGHVFYFKLSGPGAWERRTRSARIDILGIEIQLVLTLLRQKKGRTKDVIVVQYLLYMRSGTPRQGFQRGFVSRSTDIENSWIARTRPIALDPSRRGKSSAGCGNIDRRQSRDRVTNVPPESNRIPGTARREAKAENSGGMSSVDADSRKWGGGDRTSISGQCASV